MKGVLVFERGGFEGFCGLFVVFFCFFGLSFPLVDEALRRRMLDWRIHVRWSSPSRRFVPLRLLGCLSVR